MPDYYHQSVLLEEVIKYLRPQPNQNFIDGTLGGGGHSEALLQAIRPKGKVLAFELDQRAIKDTKKRLSNYQKRLTIINANFVDLAEELKKQKNFHDIAGIIIDLGLSSDQLDKSGRGFSFKDSGPLDMRFDIQNQSLTATDIILNWSESKLIKIFREYGEEQQALRLARGIIKNRSSLKQKQKLTTSMLVSTILRILNLKDVTRFRIHPATKVFQALRIAVNDELNNLTKVLPQAIKVLAPGGRLAIISFHSLEDRIVKNYFRANAKDCICPPNIPICNCNHRASVKIITKKPIIPSAKEIKNNPRSRSAKLRVIEKI